MVTKIVYSNLYQDFHDSHSRKYRITYDNELQFAFNELEISKSKMQNAAYNCILKGVTCS